MLIRVPLRGCALETYFFAGIFSKALQDKLFVLDVLNALCLVDGGLCHLLKGKQLACVDDQVYRSKLPVAYLDARVFVEELFGWQRQLCRSRCLHAFSSGLAALQLRLDIFYGAEPLCVCVKRPCGHQLGKVLVLNLALDEGRVILWRRKKLVFGRRNILGKGSVRQRDTKRQGPDKMMTGRHAVSSMAGNRKQS